MKLFPTVPHELIRSWEQSVQSLPAAHTVGFHYHDVEEWLTVVRGAITFFTLGDKPSRVDAGRTLRILRGEVHRAEVDPDGVEYQMFLPVAAPEFVNELSASELDALRRNLEFPDYEDGRRDDGRDFFESALSEELVFCRASGACVDKKTFIKEAFVDKRRSSEGSVRVLNKTKNGLLISTVVNVSNGNSVDSFTNVRFLASEDGAFRCRLWANFPQLLAAEETI